LLFPKNCLRDALMDWRLEYFDHQQVVCAEVTGRVTVAEADAMLTEMLELAQSHSVRRFLIDHTGSSLKLSLNDILGRPKHYHAIGFKPESRFAIVFPGWTTDFVLLEAAIAHDYSTRGFIERDAAMQWLVSVSP
jgi:hypothetical protein